jgi:hypothetical protein
VASSFASRLCTSHTVTAAAVGAADWWAQRRIGLDFGHQSGHWRIAERRVVRRTIRRKRAYWPAGECELSSRVS